MNTLIQKQNELEILKQKLHNYEKKVLEIEMNILELQQDIVTIIDNNKSINVFSNMELSTQQKEIVESTAKNILVIACPGSGKTHTLIARYINLVTNHNIDPSQVIMITFTKKAGMEMNNRLINVIPNKIPYYVGSLHGLGYRLIQQFMSVNKSYTILDEKESHIMLRESIDEMDNITNEELDMLKKQIPYIYDKISTDYPLNINNTLKKLSISIKHKNIINNVLKKYKLMKKSQNLIDFNDLMIQFCDLLNTKKLNSFMEGIKYIFFDEYQDINPIQHYILKYFSNSCNVMVVGDDAQAIYAFRGSSIKYIWNFEKEFDNVSTYYLETNYRSTLSIVNFCQDIIVHNSTQFKKNVISNKEQLGLKPHVICHNTIKEQYSWIAQDILKKKESGVLLKDIVILARKNYSLEKLEYELIRLGIPSIKNIGTSLLNKNHIKDFLAFIIILYNPHSIIHWKRIISMHKSIGIIGANEIINSNEVFNGMNAIITNTLLKDLHTLLLTIGKYKPREQLMNISQYLVKIWKENKESNIETNINDINNLIMYLNNNTIEEFISNLYLNIEIEYIHDSIYLSTAHSAKGLEWDYVYIIDMNNKDFPSIKQSFYLDDIDTNEEERRLFYVASSRAKKHLTITMHQDFNVDNMISISPYIRELNTNLYLGSNLMKQFSNNYMYKFTGNILTDVGNYIKYYGYTNLANFIHTIPYEYNVGKIGLFPISISLSYRIIASDMMDILVAKMIHNNFTEIIIGFDSIYSNILKNNSTIYYKYIDKLTDWRNILDDIFHMVTSHKHCSANIDIINSWKQNLLSSEALSYYNNLEKMIVCMIRGMKPSKIYLHINVCSEPIKGEIDIVVDNTLIEIKTTPDDICTFSNLCQSIVYGYLLNKKQIEINNIKLLNLWNGSIYNFNMDKFDYIKFKKTLYSIQ